MILITGSSGFIGSHLMQKIKDSYGLDNKSTSLDFKWVNCDLKNKSETFWALNELKPEYVLHNAAIPSVPASYFDPMKTYLNNVNASINLIDACKKTGVKKIIFASSSSVKGDSPYGHSKKIIEELLEKSGLNYTILRYFNVFGFRQRENVISIMYEAIKYNKEFIVNGRSVISRDFTYVDNVVLANTLAMSSDYDKQILEIGTGENYSLSWLYEFLKSRVNPFHRKLIIGPERQGDLYFSKAKTFLNENDIITTPKGLDLWLSQLQD